METWSNEIGAACHNPETDDELADVLTAISVVSKRLARKLRMQRQHETKKMEGENKDEQTK